MVLLTVTSWFSTGRMLQKRGIGDVIPVAIITAGVAIRIALYLANRSLFMDEAALQLSIRGRPISQLLGRPLDFGQTAPPAYLLLQRGILVALGDHEYAVRLLPLLAGVLALLLFAALAYRCLPRIGAHAAVALLAFSNPAVYFASYAKPYALDLLGGVLALGAAWTLLQAPLMRRESLVATGVGILVPWFSTPGAIMLAGLGGALLTATPRKERSRLLQLSATVVLWIISAVAALNTTRAAQTASGAEYLQHYWKSGFVPLHPQIWQEWFWFPLAILRFIIDPLGSWIPIAAFFGVVYGSMWLARHNRSLLLLLLGPFAVSLFASLMRVYPFGGGKIDFYPGRVSTFLVPPALLLIGASLGMIRERYGERPWLFTGFTATLLLSGALPAGVAFVLPQDDVRGVLEHIDRHAQAGDAIYIGYRAQHVARWYAPRLSGDLSLIWGACIPYQSAEAVQEVSRLNGYERAWVLFSHPYERGEQRIMRSALDQVATRVDLVALRNAEAALYQLPPDLPTEFNVSAQTFYDIGCGVFYPPHPKAAITENLRL